MRWIDIVGWVVVGFASSSAGALASPGAEPRFVIQSLGDRCWTMGLRTGTPITIEPCTRSDSQLFRFHELQDGTHDVQIENVTGSMCVGIRGATGPDLVPGQTLELQACSATPGRRFAYDGDAILVGKQPRSAAVSRDFVIEPVGENTNAGTVLAVGTREVDDPEYWRVLPFDVPGLKPHTGFVDAEDEWELLDKLDTATWGQVIEIIPPSGTIALSSVPFPLVVPEGVTVRGGRKFTDNGAEIWLPDDRPLFDPKAEDATTVFEPRSHTRITALRLRGHDAEGDGAETFGIRIGDHVGQPEFELVSDVIVDHLDLSFWSQSAVMVIGDHGLDDAFTCNPDLERDGTPVQRLIGNFFHHGQYRYGVTVSEGGAVALQGNLMYLHSHDVTSSFNNGSNRYFVTDGLFTGEVSDGTSAVLDVHGICDNGNWNGGVAGGLFESAFNSFFTPRTPVISVRGTPCEAFLLHDNVFTASEDDETLNVELFPATGGDCGSGFVPGDPDDVLVSANNTFDAVNPLASCGGTNADIDAPCSTGDLGVGDFDGDGIDDLFAGTGATWWFSAGGVAEWRFLNRKPELASEVRIGDFDGDGRSDVAAVSGAAIRVSWAGTSEWYTLNTLAEGLTVADLAVGDFDGDDRSDLFLADGATWTFASGGSGPWDFFADSTYRVPELLFGDFVNADGRTDVFGYEDGAWSVVDGPGATWTFLGRAWTTDVTTLVAADFTGDGVTDIGQYSREYVGLPEMFLGSWLVSSGGHAQPVLIGQEDQPLTDLPIGNFDGDKGDEVLLWSNERWLDIVTDTVNESVELMTTSWSRQSMR